MDKYEITKDTYNKIADKFNDKYCKEIYYKNQLDNFLTYLKKSSKILDAGCGTGLVDEYLSEKGHEVLGIDFSEEMLKIARKRAPQCRFEKMDLRNLNSENGSFDVVLALFSLCHVDKHEFESAIKQFFKSLKKRGMLFLGLQEGDLNEMVEEPLQEGLKMYFHYYEKNFVKKMLESNGFEILSSEDRFFEEEGESCNEFFITAKKTKEN